MNYTRKGKEKEVRKKFKSSPNKTS